MKRFTYPWGSAALKGGLFALLLTELYSLLPARPTPTDTAQPPSNPYLQGIVHVHSSFSDGGLSPDELALEARAAGADFVVLTDRLTTRARQEGYEKSYGGTDLFVEMEAVTPAGHAVVFFSHTEAAHLSDARVNELAWSHFLGRDTRAGMFVAIAHPSHMKTPWSHLDRFPDGVEILNLDALWRRQAAETPLTLAATLGLSPLNTYLSALRFFDVYAKDLTAWDGMNAISAGHFGYAAHDILGKIPLQPRVTLRLPPHPVPFKLVSNIVYLDEPRAASFAERKKQLYHALSQGRIAVTFPAVHPFAGNDWRLECSGKTFRAGYRGRWEPGCEFVVETPASLTSPRWLRWIRNGEIWEEGAVTEPLVRKAIPREGFYRVEVWVKTHSLFFVLLHSPVPYVFYNPIYLR